MLGLNMACVYVEVKANVYRGGMDSSVGRPRQKRVAGRDKTWGASGLLKDRGDGFWEALGSSDLAEAQP